MKRTVETYMGFPYTIEITPDEGTFFVKVKELEGCMSVGESEVDALSMIKDAMHEWFSSAIEDDLEIPLPEATQQKYGGKFPLRLPKSLHAKLAEGADQDGISLNQYLVMLLSERHSLHQVKKLLAQENDPTCKEIEVEPSMTYTGRNAKVLSFHRRVLNVVGG